MSICCFLLQLQLNKTLSKMVALILQLSPISDSTDLWGTLNIVSEALGNTLRVVSYLIEDENLGNGTNSTTRSDNYTATVSTLPFNQAPWTLTEWELGTNARKGDKKTISLRSLRFSPGAQPFNVYYEFNRSSWIAAEIAQWNDRNARCCISLAITRRRSWIQI